MKKPTTHHTHAVPGRRVRVFLQNGEDFVDSFKDFPRGKFYEFEKRGKVKASTIRKVELYSKSKEIHTALIRVNRK